MEIDPRSTVYSGGEVELPRTLLGYVARALLWLARWSPWLERYAWRVVLRAALPNASIEWKTMQVDDSALTDKQKALLKSISMD